MKIHKNIYQLLGLSEKVTSSTVKKMFKEFAKRNHPDFFPGDKNKEEKFKLVTSAYQNWKNIQATLAEMSRIRENSSAEFQPWAFKYAARRYQEVMV